MKRTTELQRIAKLEKLIEAQTMELQELRKKFEDKRPKWTRRTGDQLVIAQMDDSHLLNSIKVCLRMDSRYPMTPSRMAEFFNMVVEFTMRPAFLDAPLNATEYAESQMDRCDDTSCVGCAGCTS